MDTHGGRQSLGAVTESGLYTLIIRSRCASTPGSTAHRFRKWVTGKVLPQIRRTGSYAPPAAPAPLAIDVRAPRQLSQIALQLLQVTHEQARELADLRVDPAESETRHELAKPKIEAYEALLDDEGCAACGRRRAPYRPRSSSSSRRSVTRAGSSTRRAGPSPVGSGRDRHFVVKHRTVGGVVRGQTYVARPGLVLLRDRWQAKLLVDAREAERARSEATLDL